MKFFNKVFIKYIILVCLISIIQKNSFAGHNDRRSDNNAFVFNGSTSELYVNDNSPVNADANQNGFEFFNSNSNNNKITVQAWVYLIGDNNGIKMPIVYRAVEGGTTFSLYVKNNKGFFSVGNNNTATVQTAEFPAFEWVSISGTYDGNTLRIYLNGEESGSNSDFNIISGYSISNSSGLFIGKSAEGTFKGLIDEIRFFNVALSGNSINNSGGNGNPAENISSSLTKYLAGQWSFNEISNGNLLKDLSKYKNYLHVNDINQIVPSKKPGLLVVNSIGDESTSNCGNNIVTLRSAIERANSLSGTQIIYFYIPGAGPFDIQPASALPNITEAVYLDGTTQKGYDGSPLVSTSGAFGGLTISSGNSIVQGLSLNSSSGYGLSLFSVGSNNILANNISGILISTSGNKINGNTITGSIKDGITIIDGGINNFIGDLITNNILINEGYGISITSVNSNQIINNSIESNNHGGIFISNSTGTFSGNNISGNTGNGLFLFSSNSNTFSGNTFTGNLFKWIIYQWK